MDDRFDRTALSPRRGSDLMAAAAARDTATALAASDGEPPTEDGQDLSGALRHLWIRRRTLALATLAGAALAYAAVSSIPSFYTGEARLLVGVPAPRALNVEAVIADIGPDAERVQNESFILQSRPIAAQVIEDLHLDRKAEFNPELATPTIWSRTAAWLEAETPAWLSDLLGRLPTGAAPAAPATAPRSELDATRRQAGS